MPLISIIIPVYNAEFFLHRCLDSLLMQKFTNFEIILINDGSKDNSGKYVMNMLTITLKYEFFILLMVVQGKHGIKG